MGSLSGEVAVVAGLWQCDRVMTQPASSWWQGAARAVWPPGPLLLALLVVQLAWESRQQQQ